MKSGAEGHLNVPVPERLGEVIRLGLYRLVQMPGGHELMYANPAGMA
ncbi:MAG: hypothetical protein ABWY93_02150 [Mycobacterium sp.]